MSKRRNHDTAFKARVALVARCHLLSLSRSSFSCALRGETAMNLDLMLLIDHQFQDALVSGVRPMMWHLQNEAHAVNEKRVRRLMRLMPIYQKPDSSGPAYGHRSYRYLPGGLRVERTSQVWCADITSIPTQRGSSLSRRHLGLVHRHGAGLTPFGHPQGRLLRRGVERRHPSLWSARTHEHGSGIAGHVYFLDRPAEAGRHPDLDGRKRPLSRQQLHRVPLAVPGA